MNRLQLVRWEFGVAWASLDTQLDQLTDDECLWEPTRRCWNVRRTTERGWVADWQVPMPEPLPVTTIAWRTWHIGSWWSYALTATFTGNLTACGINATDDIVTDSAHASRDMPSTTGWPGDASLTVQWLRQLHIRWLEELDDLGEDDLDAFDRSVWLQRGTKPLAHLLVWVNAELTRSAAEIGLLRSLYASTG